MVSGEVGGGLESCVGTVLQASSVWTKRTDASPVVLSCWPQPGSTAIVFQLGWRRGLAAPEGRGSL